MIYDVICIYLYKKKRWKSFEILHTIVARQGGANRERKPKTKKMKMKMCFNGFRAKMNNIYERETR
jgi:hypothetical protein